MSNTNTKAFLDGLSKLSEEERDAAVEEIANEMHTVALENVKKFVQNFDYSSPIETLSVLILSGILCSFSKSVYEVVKKNKSISRFETQNIMCSTLIEQINQLKFSQENIKKFMEQKDQYKNN